MIKPIMMLYQGGFGRRFRRALGEEMINERRNNKDASRWNLERVVYRAMEQVNFSQGNDLPMYEQANLWNSNQVYWLFYDNFLIDLMLLYIVHTFSFYNEIKKEFLWTLSNGWDTCDLWADGVEGLGDRSSWWYGPRSHVGAFGPSLKVDMCFRKWRSGTERE